MLTKQEQKKKKLVLGLLKRLDTLLEESGEIWYIKHGEEEYDKDELEKRQRANDLSIRRTKEALEQELDTNVPEQIHDKQQMDAQKVFGEVDSPY